MLNTVEASLTTNGIFLPFALSDLPLANCIEGSSRTVTMNTIKIPFWLAILINVNIVIGSAFFLGASKISAACGILAPFAWLACGLMLLPLVLVFARLSQAYPTAGGIYVYSQQQLGNFWGLVSGWGYFIGTAAANAAVLHAFGETFFGLSGIQTFMQNYGLSILWIDGLLLGLFTLLSLLNIEFLEGAQLLFTALKSIPMILAVIALPFLFNVSNLTTASYSVSGLFKTLPLVLFAFVGIEACCAVADKIENGHKNASRVIFISFALIMGIYTLLQFSLLAIHGSQALDPFLNLLPKLTSNALILSWGHGLILCAILASFLAGFYGMFYFNHWNLFAMGKDNSLIGSKYLIKQNKNQAPWICVLIQAALILVFLLISQQSYYLVAMADFGTVIAYLLSALALIKFSRAKAGYFALGSCAVLIYITSSNLIAEGLHFALPFALILLLGLVAHKLRHVA
jgi:APA family basic amino acid/polyamine antiporter